jgi:hypothetical protein
LDYFTDDARVGSKTYAGPGVYFATGTTSSKSFGVCCVTWTLPDGVYYYDASIARRVLGYTPGTLEKVHLLKRSKIPQIHFYGGAGRDWYMSASYNVFTSVKINMDANIKQSFSNWMLLLEFMEHFNRGPQYIQGAVGDDTMNLWRHTTGYIYSLYSLMYYVDPAAMTRAINVSPGSPWDVFDMNNFGTFSSGRSELLHQILVDKKPLGIGGKSYYLRKAPADSDHATWAEAMVFETYPHVFKTLTSNDMVVRWYPIRAGGSEKGDTFMVTGRQADWMDSVKNPYIEPTCNPIKGEDGHSLLCSYQYPSTKAYARKLKSVVSDDMFKKLEASPQGQAANDLNAKLTEAVLLDAMKKISGTSAADQSAFAAMSRLIAAHGSTDQNSLVARTFAQLGAIEAGKPPPVVSSFDFDVTTLGSLQRKFVSSTVAAYQHIIQEMLRAAFDAAAQNEHVSVEKHLRDIDDGWISTFSGFQTFGVVRPSQWDNKFDALIRDRKWIDLFDELGGSSWVRARGISSTSFKDATPVER